MQTHMVDGYMQTLKLTNQDMAMPALKKQSKKD
jgi:hypothetical protein